jgi:hypothetical protein
MFEVEVITSEKVGAVDWLVRSEDFPGNKRALFGWTLEIRL